MIAMTTSNSISVNPRFRRMRAIVKPVEKGARRCGSITPVFTQSVKKAVSALR